MVEQIEYFRTELQEDIFVELDVLEHREIYVTKARPDNDVTSEAYKAAPT